MRKILKSTFALEESKGDEIFEQDLTMTSFSIGTTAKFVMLETASAIYPSATSSEQIVMKFTEEEQITVLIKFLKKVRKTLRK